MKVCDDRMETVLITGSLRGIGRELGVQLCRLGYHVIFSGRDRHEGAQLISTLLSDGHSASYLHLDLRDAMSVHSAVYECISVYHGIDVLINNAAVCLDDWSMVSWEQSVLVNVDAHVALIEALVPGMMERSQGKESLGMYGGSNESNGSSGYPRCVIINISSGDGELCYMNDSEILRDLEMCESVEQYGAVRRRVHHRVAEMLVQNEASEGLVHGSQPCYKLSKMLLNAYSRVLMHQNAVLVYCVCPGDVDTRMADKHIVADKLVPVADCVQYIIPLVVDAQLGSGFYRFLKPLAW